jgi:hypothetical protein
MLLDLLARRDDQAEDLHPLGTNGGLRLGRGERRPQGPNVHDLARLGVWNGHRRFLHGNGAESALETHGDLAKALES